MPFLSTRERHWLQTLSQLAYCNPFIPAHTVYEQQLLGDEFLETEATWNLRGGDGPGPRVHPTRICTRLAGLLDTLRTRLSRGEHVTEQDLLLYEDGVVFLLYYRYADRLYEAIRQSAEQPDRRHSCPCYTAFQQDWSHYFAVPGFTRTPLHDAPHIFACFFQVRRAFHHIFRYLIGGSKLAVQLRATVWESIFTHDMRRYRRTLYACMGDFTTLITGPSGSGKELVAQAIGLSRYLPFEANTLTFTENFAGSLYALNLSALPSTLIESELFGHRRGAFTGAVHDRRGWLEMCSTNGTVYLDEIGDLEPALQIKLLRVLQTRTFQRLGDTASRHFRGKLIAATNRDLAAAMHQGYFREDLYYRLCSDLVVTPSLYEQLHESPAVLQSFLLFLTQRIVGRESEALAAETASWVHTHMGPEYPWPGNIRELEQCIRNVLIRREYRPIRRTPVPADALAHDLADGHLTADELLRRYCTLVYARTGSYEETARRLQLDRRTVKSKIDTQYLHAQESVREETIPSP